MAAAVGNCTAVVTGGTAAGAGGAVTGAATGLATAAAGAAEAAIGALRQDDPECTLYQLYLDRIRRYRDQPPGADWDGVTTFETK